MNYFKNIFKSIHQLFWLRYTKAGKEYAKKYKQERIKELTKSIKKRGNA